MKYTILALLLAITAQLAILLVNLDKLIAIEYDQRTIQSEQRDATWCLVDNNPCK